jgi:type VI protein secretion system component VasF
MAQPVDDPEDAHAYTRREIRESWARRRRRKIREEIERNRRGEAKIPTWVLAVVLLVVVVGWIAWIVLLG